MRLGQGKVVSRRGEWQQEEVELSILRDRLINDRGTSIRSRRISTRSNQYQRIAGSENNMTREEFRDSLTGSGKMVARGLNQEPVTNSTPKESGIVKKGGQQPTKPPPPPKLVIGS